MLEILEKETGTNPQWSIIWLHGLGADNRDFLSIVPELVPPGGPIAVRFVFPNAPMRAVTINNGMVMRAWYDILSTDFEDDADAEGIAQSVKHVNELIAYEEQRGIAHDHIFLAGFSQGGAITLYAGLQQNEPLAGLIALSAYLPDRYTAQATKQALTQPLFMANGKTDTVIPLSVARGSVQVLKQLGFDPKWLNYPMAHQICAAEIRDLSHWLHKRMEAHMQEQ